jgi:hypothetical protein
MSSAPKPWETYEQVATFLLGQISEQFGLVQVEGKQSVPGLKSGTSWQIDAKGMRQGGTGFVLIEMRRHTTSSLSQEELAAIAYRIDDTGAAGGIVVSPLPLQKGAKLVAQAASVVHVQLNESCTTTEYILRFLNQVMISLAPETFTSTVSVLGGTLTTVDETCANSDAAGSLQSTKRGSLDV